MRQPVLNLHLARAYPDGQRPGLCGTHGSLTVRQLQIEARTAAASVTKPCSNRPALTPCVKRNCWKPATADDFFAIFKDGKVSIVYFLKRLHNFALSLGWIALPVVAPYLWPKYEAKERRGITPDEHQSIIALEKKAEWKLFLELLWKRAQRRVTPPP